MSNEATGIEAMVCRDIAERQAVGIETYGGTVADNPGDLDYWLKHLYEELLDAAIYLKRIRMERAGSNFNKADCN